MSLQMAIDTLSGLQLTSYEREQLRFVYHDCKCRGDFTVFGKLVRIIERQHRLGVPTTGGLFGDCDLDETNHNLSRKLAA